MQARGWHWGAALAATCATTSAHAVLTEAQIAERESTRDAAVVANMRQLAPAAVAAYEAAVGHAHAGRLGEAEKLLVELHHEVPGLTAVTRRLCLVEGALGKRDEALALCREAAGDGSSSSLAALSYALTGFGDLHHDPPPAARTEALDLAERAVKRDAEDVLAQRALCLAARAANDGKKMRGCTQALERLDTADNAASMWLERARLFSAPAIENAEPDPVRLDEGAYAAKHAAELRAGWAEPSFVLAEIAMRRGDHAALEAALGTLHQTAPDDPRTAELDTIAALAIGDLEAAREALARAEELGLDDASLGALRGQLGEAQPAFSSWLPLFGGVLALSAGALALYGWRRKRGGAA